MQVALPFIDDGDDEDSVTDPQDGLDYLRKVRREAKNIDVWSSFPNNNKPRMFCASETCSILLHQCLLLSLHPSPLRWRRQAYYTGKSGKNIHWKTFVLRAKLFAHKRGK